MNISLNARRRDHAGRPNKPSNNDTQRWNLQTAVSAKLTSLRADTVSFSFKGANDTVHNQKNTNPAKKHEVAIVDNFDKKVIDIDGDNVSDLSHGEVTKRIAQSADAEAKILKFQINYDENNPLSFDLSSPIKKLNEVSDLIKQGEPIEAVNLSLKQDFDVLLLSELSKHEITADNLGDKREALRAWLDDPKISTKHKVIMESNHAGAYNALMDELSSAKKVVDAIESITEKGVPVYISAGNDGNKTLNLFTLAKGSVSVGGTNATGDKMPFSPQHSLIKNYSQAIYNISPIKKDGELEGFDISGSGKAEVLLDEVSGGTPMVKPYQNKKISDALASEADFNTMVTILNNAVLIRKIKSITDQQVREGINESIFEQRNKQAVFPINLVKSLYGLSDYETEGLKAKGTLVNPQLNLVFRMGEDDKLVYDPDNSGREAVNEIWGTSFASPKAMMQDLTKAKAE